MKDLFTKKITVFISVPATEIKSRTFEKRVIDKCSIQSETVEKNDGTIRRVINARTVITKDVANYVEPREFYNTPSDIRANIFTINTNDFIIFGECEDVVVNALDFANVQQKYRDNGMVANSVSAYINGLSTDNITITNA